MNRHTIATQFADRSSAEREELGRHLRDRFFELARAKQDDPELRALVDAIDPEPATHVDGLAVAWHPTARYKALRFVEASRLDETVRDRFARPAAPHLAAVFVDPSELSFRTYENIVPLDRLFESIDGAQLKVGLASRKKLAKTADIYSFAIEPTAPLRAALSRLDALGLYVPPLNAVSRGGERYIFHSALLADALTAAMREAMPKSLMAGFSHVNPIFRCNRFEPTDERFHRHHDTPYFDAARQHVSRYTVLLYLTGGTGAPALDVTGHAQLETIDELTCIVLDQQHAHEGAPYRDGRKVFLRTELVFTDAELVHDPAIAALFSKAVYWTGQSIFEPELARHADAYYNQVAAAHWNGLADATTVEPFVHKQFRGVHFVANGHDFWFAKDPDLSLAECAAITLLDYFNCKLGDTPFRSACKTTVIEDQRDAAWIPGFLASKRSEPAFAPLDKAALFPAPEATDDVCCPFHGYPRFDATRHSEIVDLYARAQTFAKAHIDPAPIVMLGQEVALDASRFVIEADRIHVTGKAPLAPVNFAACWNSGGTPENYLDVEATVGVVQLLVPPIMYRETSGCYHLSFDFFRNSWMVKSAQVNVPVPRIRNLEEDPEEMDEEEQFPWIDAVDVSTIRGGKPGAVAKLWWAPDTELMRELFTLRIEREADAD